MAAPASILIADDEEAFRGSTGRLLKREGFDCYCTGDAEEAVDRLRRDRFDLLISEIRVPCNADLWVVRSARELDGQMPVIVVTGYPSAETAICAVQLSVAAYLTKPVDFEELLPCIRAAVGSSQDRRALSAVRRRLSSCLADLEALPPARSPREDEAAQLVSKATIRTLASCLSELLEVADRSAGCREMGNLCELLDCSRHAYCREAIVRTIDVLKKTKDTFKSKMLAELRKELEVLV